MSDISVQTRDNEGSMLGRLVDTSIYNAVPKRRELKTCPCCAGGGTIHKTVEDLVMPRYLLDYQPGSSSLPLVVSLGREILVTFVGYKVCSSSFPAL